MNATAPLTDYAREVKDKLNDNDRAPNVIVANRKMNTFNEYVFLFASNLNKIIGRYDLTKVEIRIVLQILELMQFGNLISLSIKGLAAALDMDKGNVSRAMKRLRETELIIEDRGCLYFNPHIAAKGFFNEKNADDRHLLEASADSLESHNSPADVSIGTPAIRQSRRNRKKEDKSETVSA